MSRAHMVQNCPDDSTTVRSDVLPAAVLVLDASPARPPCSLIGLSAECACSQCIEQGLLIRSDDTTAALLPPTHVLPSVGDLELAALHA